MKSIRILVVGLALLGSAAAFAQNVAGSWKGKLDIQMGQLPTNLTPEQKQMVQQQLEATRKAKIDLVVNSNKTFSLSSAVGPQGTQKTEGKWKVEKEFLVLTPVTNNGKTVPTEQAKPIKMKIEKGGKQLSAVLPPMPMGKATLTFTR